MVFESDDHTGLDERRWRHGDAKVAERSELECEIVR